jgi:hypothetical protein
MRDKIDRFLTWARRRPDVRAGVILGSWARSEVPADNMSDLDLLVIVSDPSVFLLETSWLLTFGEPCLTLWNRRLPEILKSGERHSRTGKILIFL